MFTVAWGLMDFNGEFLGACEIELNVFFLEQFHSLIQFCLVNGMLSNGIGILSSTWRKNLKFQLERAP